MSCIVVTLQSAYGGGSGQTWLDHVDCNGTEPFISFCNPQWGNADNCHHDHDASVVCNSKCYNIKGWGLIIAIFQGNIGQSGWLMVQLKLKVELRSSTMDNGEQFVVTSGISMLQVLSAECLALLGPPMLGKDPTLE